MLLTLPSPFRSIGAGQVSAAINAAAPSAGVSARADAASFGRKPWSSKWAPTAAMSNVAAVPSCESPTGDR